MPLSLRPICVLLLLLPLGCSRSGEDAAFQAWLQTVPAAPRADVDAFVEGNNRFALDLYGQLRGQEGNLVLSPFSISTALAMTYAGARGETAEEMARTLHFTLPQERLHAASAGLLRELFKDRKPTSPRLRIANALWGQKGTPFVPDFIQTMDRSYHAGLREGDYIGDPEAARQTINRWVEDKTEQKIRDLLAPGVLDSLTRLVLVNAIYFNGDWEHAFDAKATQQQDFYRTAQDKVAVPTMHQMRQFHYFENDTVQMVELPYRDSTIAMTLILPKTRHGLAEVERGLAWPRLREWLGKLDQAEVDLSLPRFKATRDFKLAETLQRLGMVQAFQDDGADFSGMCTAERLHIAQVIHQAFIDVHEKGTEAAAATAVVMAVKSLRERVEFRADHPFLYLLHDRNTGSILFVGRVTDPAGK